MINIITYFTSLFCSFDINVHLQTKANTEINYFLKMWDTLIGKLVPVCNIEKGIEL